MNIALIEPLHFFSFWYNILINIKFKVYKDLEKKQIISTDLSVHLKIILTDLSLWVFQIVVTGCMDPNNWR